MLDAVFLRVDFGRSGCAVVGEVLPLVGEARGEEGAVPLEDVE